MLLVLCSKSSPLYVLNDWMDANIFFTMGQSMLGGKVLYRDVFDHKGPVPYLLYGLAALIDYTDFTRGAGAGNHRFCVFVHGSAHSGTAGRAGTALPAWWTVLPAAGIAAKREFSHGGSAEELLLPFLGAALFSAVRTLQDTRSRCCCARSACTVFWPDVPWLRYTVLGFYLAWVVVLAVVYLWRGWRHSWAEAWARTSAAWRWPHSPWVVYFGVNSALGDWFTAYFYDNLFLYKGRAAVCLRWRSTCGGRCGTPCLPRCCWRRSCSGHC